MERLKFKIFAVAVFLSVLALCFFSRILKAQDSQDFDMEAKLNQIALKQESMDREIQQKLDKILANQETILQELAVVKVRASRK